MNSAFLLVQTLPGQAGQVVSRISELGDVESVEAVTGPYDAVARINGTEATADDVRRQIAALDHVVRTLTCPVGAEG